MTVKDLFLPRGNDETKESQPLLRGQDLFSFILLQLSSSISTMYTFCQVPRGLVGNKQQIGGSSWQSSNCLTAFAILISFLKAICERSGLTCAWAFPGGGTAQYKCHVHHHSLICNYSIILKIEQNCCITTRSMNYVMRAHSLLSATPGLLHSNIPMTRIGFPYTHTPGVQPITSKGPSLISMRLNRNLHNW